MKNNMINIYYCRKYWKFVFNYIDSLFIKYHLPLKMLIHVLDSYQKSSSYKSVEYQTAFTGIEY